jgi:hypothetical protein
MDLYQYEIDAENNYDILSQSETCGIQIMMKFFSVLFFLIMSSTVQAYPDFIGYGYRSCVTCHYSGGGGGAINDYGRAVWASEITSKSIFHKRTSDEKMAESSGFLGKKQLPWWIRPGVKYRGLYLVRDPGSKASIERWIDMQGEVNAAFFLDQDQKYTLYGSYGYRPIPESFRRRSSSDQPEEWITREHFVKVRYRDDLYLYAGLMDKVFGIKNVDHTGYNRRFTQLTMDDQSHGVLAHVIKDEYEVFGQVFVGNLQQDEKLRPQGVAVHYDKAMGEKTAVGASFLTQSNDFTERQMVSGQYRQGLREKGNSLNAEIGLVNEKPKNRSVSLGAYSYFQGVTRIARGQHLLVKFETWKPDLDSDSNESFRYGIGFLSFPWAKTEFRFDLYNQRTLVPAQANQDTWIATGQIHLSL